ncbi:uncharacterized protein NEMAJ01_0519 [Nematocida major]|uniref:uncharacterized protein n=1 Tax=Nematocida major TaxID=1912982 RepID=UPI00200856E5|nr:uncharacterized protein NEMAJ01_0519 [Nematocida major]KAH9385623.1 hypothetical protein NEMAJ01_0519 [Nematocida major]
MKIEKLLEVSVLIGLSFLQVSKQSTPEALPGQDVADSLDILLDPEQEQELLNDLSLSTHQLAKFEELLQSQGDYNELVSVCENLDFGNFMESESTSLPTPIIDFSAIHTMYAESMDSAKENLKAEQATMREPVFNSTGFTKQGTPFPETQPSPMPDCGMPLEDLPNISEILSTSFGGEVQSSSSKSSACSEGEQNPQTSTSQKSVNIEALDKMCVSSVVIETPEVQKAKQDQGDSACTSSDVAYRISGEEVCSIITRACSKKSRENTYLSFKYQPEKKSYCLIIETDDLIQNWMFDEKNLTEKSKAYMNMYRKKTLCDQFMSTQEQRLDVKKLSITTLEAAKKNINRAHSVGYKILQDFTSNDSIWRFLIEFLGPSNNVYTDVQLLSELNNTLEFPKRNLIGYYFSIFADLQRYIEATTPSRILVASCRSDLLPKNSTQTLGDVFLSSPIPRVQLKKTMDAYLKYEDPQKGLFGVLSILSLPEVYCDFENIPSDVFSKVLNGFIFKIKALKDPKEQKYLYEKTRILWFLYSVVNKDSKMSALWKSQLFEWHNNFVQSHSQFGNSFGIIYKKAYSAVAMFYEKCPSISTQESGGNDQIESPGYKVQGINVIVNQLYKKIAMSVQLNACGEFVIKKMKFVDQYNCWQAEPPKLHTHIHFVDNFKQEYKMVCFPLFIQPGAPPCPMHCARGICWFLSNLYSIPIKDIYPMKHCKATDMWCLLHEDDMQKSMKEQLFGCDNSVVFYYISNSSPDQEYTFSVFQKQYNPRITASGRIQIPLFLSPLMQSALSLTHFVQHGKRPPYSRKLSEFTQNYVFPSVYIPKVELFKKKREAYQRPRAPFLTYFGVSKYYANLYLSCAKPTAQCHSMRLRIYMINQGENEYIFTWCIKMCENKNVYRHYFFESTVAAQSEFNSDQVAQSIEKICQFYYESSLHAHVSIYSSEKSKSNPILLLSPADFQSFCRINKTYCYKSSVLVAFKSIQYIKPELNVHNNLMRFLLCKQ